MADVPRRLPPTHGERLAVALGMAPGSGVGGTRFARPVPASVAALTRAVVPTQQPEGNGWWPTGWVQLPMVVVQSMVASHAVFEDPTQNYVAFQWGSGAYTVDWGDGTVENYAGEALATHQFLWGNVSSSTVAPGGYRQAVVTVTPQPGQLFTDLRLNQHNPASSVYSTGWLAITVCGPLVTSLSVYGNYTHPLLAQFRYVGPSKLVGTSSMFALITSLQSVVGTEWTATCSDLRQMFQGCSQLTAIDAFDTHSSTDFSYMCYGCTSLTVVPLLDVHASTAFDYMFNGCPNLQVGALAGTSKSISYAGCALPAAALNDVFTNLAAVAAGSQTVDITGNPGAAGCDRSIATSKGWTVTG